MSRVKLVAILETPIEIQKVRMIRGRYPNPHHVDIEFSKVLEKCVADEKCQVLAFSIEEVSEEH